MNAEFIIPNSTFIILHYHRSLSFTLKTLLIKKLLTIKQQHSAIGKLHQTLLKIPVNESK